MQIDWSPLKNEMALWRGDGLDLPLWWRDDDAVTCTPALDHLSGVSARLGLPVHLAVIPERADRSLADQCRRERNLIPMVHGWAHANHAPEGQKKAEFGYPRVDLEDDAMRGITRLQALFGPDLLPVFVPPWNRITADIIPALAPMGYVALSTFTPRAQRLAAPDLVQINTHIDPIDWRGGGGLVSPDLLVGRVVETLMSRREGRTNAAEPLGVLTHHLVHDAAIWEFTQGLIETLLQGGARAVDLRACGGALP